MQVIITAVGPDHAGLADPRPPAGEYRCRFIKLGSQGSVPLSFVAYPWFRCRIQDQGETLRFSIDFLNQRQFLFEAQDEPTLRQWLEALRVKI